MLPRTLHASLLEATETLPVVTLTGPRQSGKTTPVRAAFPDLPYATLEAPDAREWALQDPRGFLNGFPDGAILDEVPRAPELLSYIQGMVEEDAHPSPLPFLAVGARGARALGPGVPGGSRRTTLGWNRA